MISQKGQTIFFVLIGILVIVGIAGGAYYLGRQIAPKPSLTIRNSADLCSTEGDTILAVVTNFENLQRNRDAKGVLKLFTKPQSQNDIDDYNNLSGEDMHIEPRLYSNVSTSTKILSYKIIKQPTKYNNSCKVEVEEERSYYGGPANPQYLPAKNEDFNLTLIKQSDSWMIDQYQSQDPKIRNGKYSGWLMEIANLDEAANWKTYTNKDYKFLIKYPSNMVYEEPANDTYLLLVAFKDPAKPIWSDTDNFTLEVVKSKNLEDEIEYRRWQIEGHVADSMKKESKITVGGYEGARLEYEISTSDPNSKKDFIIVIIKSEKYNYVIQASSELIDKIVSSFQILK